jgi:hypothetical protein
VIFGIESFTKSRREKCRKVGPKYQSEDMCDESQRSGQGSTKILKGRRSCKRRNFGIRGIIREEE